MRNAGAVIHSHGMESCLVTMLNPQAKEFRVSCNAYLVDNSRFPSRVRTLHFNVSSCPTFHR